MGRHGCRTWAGRHARRDRAAGARARAARGGRNATARPFAFRAMLALRSVGRAQLFWFHATRRPAVDHYVGVLRDGCRPPPTVSETQQLELALDITPPRVYCYLGRTLEQFGEFCLVFEPPRLPTGNMSPFDTGGLVRKIRPVSDWQIVQRVEYLRALSFSTQTMDDMLAGYPADQHERYLDCERPTFAGPHEIWTDAPIADIWAQGTHWRAWTWEGRWEMLPVAGTIRAWTCAPAIFMDIVERIEAAPDLPVAVVDDFLARFRPGGVSALVADLRVEQRL